MNHYIRNIATGGNCLIWSYRAILHTAVTSGNILSLVACTSSACRLYNSYGRDVVNRALSWSHDAWALIELIALLSAILVLGNVWWFGTFDTYNSGSKGTSKNHIFTNVSHVLDHNNIYFKDTLK